MAKYLKIPSSSKRRVLLTTFGSGLVANKDESTLPITSAKEIYNFDFSSGALKEGYGLCECSEIAREDVTNVWQYKRYDYDNEAYETILMYSVTDGTIYYIKDGETNALDVTIDSVPYAVDYRLYGDDVVLLCSESDYMVVWNGIESAYSVSESPLISSMTMHYERMFATTSGEANSVWFSDDLDPTNWSTDLDEGGFISLQDERGKLNKVISYLNYVYIFRDYGISRLTAYADQTEFTVNNLFVSSGQIYSKSVALCGDQVIFLARDGLYVFDGLDTTKILSQISPLVKSSPNAFGQYHNGKYYLALNLDFGDDDYDESTNNAMIVYDIDDGTYSICKGMSIARLASTDEKLYAVTASGKVGVVEICGSVFDEPTEKFWASGEIDYSTERIKTVREVYVESDYEFTLTIYSEKKRKEFVVSPSDGLTKIRVNISGRKIGMEITANTQLARITRPTLVITTT